MRPSNTTAPRLTAITLLCASLFALSTPAHAQGTDPIVPRYPTPLTEAEIKAKDKAAKDAAALAKEAANLKAKLAAAEQKNRQLERAAKKSAPPARAAGWGNYVTKTTGQPYTYIDYYDDPTPLSSYDAYPNGPKLILLPQTDDTNMLLGSSMDANTSAHEKPAYRVIVNYRLSIGQTEVTRAQWHDCVNDNGCAAVDTQGFGEGRKPVRMVSFKDRKKKNDVASYLDWLNKKAKIDPTSPYRYRLPTEAEWEYAARAGGRGDYSLGADNNTALSMHSANYNNNLKNTQTVAEFPANKWGLHDMHGNVWEWVADCWDENAYKVRAATLGGWRADQLGAERKISSNCMRVNRGGSWLIGDPYLRSSYRSYGLPNSANPNLGFRLARTLP